MPFEFFDNLDFLGIIATFSKKTLGTCLVWKLFDEISQQLTSSVHILKSRNRLG